MYYVFGELKETFVSLVGRYCPDTDIATSLWQEIQQAYSHKFRHYHNISHLEQVYLGLRESEKCIADWDTVLFALYYHDIIYKVPGSDNEEKSAKLATERMKSIGVPEKTISKCHDWILATKSHQPSIDNDCNLLLDADMAILGQSPVQYDSYRQNVRKEFSFYPDLLYNPGRKKVLQSFLKMEQIYHTPQFAPFEKQARENISRELNSL